MHLHFQCCIVTHNYFVEFHIVSNYNTRFLKILRLILGVIFMLPTVNMTVIIIFPAVTS